MSVCVRCDGRIKNTGVPSGINPFGRIVMGYYVPLVADDGTRNGLDLSNPDMDQELLDKIYHEDPSKRFYPLLSLKNVDPTKEDSGFETDDANIRNKVLDGRETMSFQLWDVTRQYFKQVEDVCVEFGFMPGDNCGNLLGEWDEENDMFYPRDVNEGSYDSKYMNTRADGTAKIMISFDYDVISSESDQIMLAVDTFTSVNPLKLRGMIDINIEVLSVDSDTQITVKTNSNFGTAGALKPFKGAGAGDFVFYNNSTNTSIGAPSALATTSDDGVYELTFTAQAVTDEIEVDIYRAGAGNNMPGFEGIPTTFEAIV